MVLALFLHYQLKKLGAVEGEELDGEPVVGVLGQVVHLVILRLMVDQALEVSALSVFNTEKLLLKLVDGLDLQERVKRLRDFHWVDPALRQQDRREHLAEAVENAGLVLKLRDVSEALHREEKVLISPEQLGSQDHQVSEVCLAKAPGHLAEEENEVNHDLRIGRLQESVQSEILDAGT